jgi:GNAT superfamily N-acetyltransferase
MIRHFQETDLHQCVELFISTFAHPPGNENWDRLVVRSRLEQIVRTPMFFGVVIGTSTDVLTGFAMGFSEPWHEGTHFYLKEMCIQHELQRKGIGSQLMEYVLLELRGRGSRRIYLLTARGDMSEAFYAKMGLYTSPKMILMARRIEGVEGGCD